MSTAAALSTGTTSAQNPGQNTGAPKQGAPAPAPVAAATPTTTEKAATAQGEEAVRKFKLKVDGEELELPEAEVLARAQKVSAAEKRFLEGKKAREEAEKFLGILRSDFTKLLDDPRLGIDENKKRELFEQWYKQKYIDPETLTPEQKRQLELERKLQTYEEQEKKRKEFEKAQRLKALEDHHRVQFQKTIVEALSKEGLPKSERTVSRMADLMAQNLQMGLELTPDQIATIVRDEYVTEIKSVLGSSDGKALLTLLGEDVLNTMRKADLEALRAGMPNVPKPTLETPKAEAQAPKRKYQTWDEMREERERRARELQASWRK